MKPRLHHLTLTVTNIELSSQWYQQLLGPAIVFERKGPGFRRARLTWPHGLIIGLTEHEETKDQDRFHHSRVGMDHVALSCETRSEVEAWAAHMHQQKLQCGSIEEVFYGWAVTARDPDGIPIEFFCFNAEHLETLGLDSSFMH
jgi:catechol 2,3-dioxygenase-like lactoylglutathione lyase family enzyme